MNADIDQAQAGLASGHSTGHSTGHSPGRSPAGPQPLAGTIDVPAERGERATVLCVDDEPNILLALQRVLRRSGHRVLTAASGAEAIALLEREPVHVLLSDMRMPGMDGAELLALAHEQWPQTVRLLLTGHADHEATVRAINRGKVSGYLMKPWDADDLLATIGRAADLAKLTSEKSRLEALTLSQNEALQALNASLEARVEARTAELAEAHAKLKRNFMTSIKVFANLIELRSGQLIGHGRRVADLARRIAVALDCTQDEIQRIFVAGLLHDIGLIGMPDVALARPVPRLEPEHQALYRRHGALGEQSLLALDDMQPVAVLIRQHHERFDGQGFPDGLAGTAIELGARILAVADTYDELLSGAFGAPGLTNIEVRVLMQRGRGSQFDPQVLDALLQTTQPQSQSPQTQPPVAVNADQLAPGMVLAADLLSREGVLLLPKDLSLTADMIRRINGYTHRESLAVTLQIKAGRPPLAQAKAA